MDQNFYNQLTKLKEFQKIESLGYTAYTTPKKMKNGTIEFCSHLVGYSVLGKSGYVRRLEPSFGYDLMFGDWSSGRVRNEMSAAQGIPEFRFMRSIETIDDYKKIFIVILDIIAKRKDKERKYLQKKGYQTFIIDIFGDDASTMDKRLMKLFSRLLKETDDVGELIYYFYKNSFLQSFNQ